MAPLGMTPKERNMVVVLLAGAVLVVLNQTLLSPALPSIMQHLQVDATTVQWLTSAYALTEAVVIPLAAWFMGRFSTRQLYIGGMVLFGVGSFVAAIAPVFPVLLLGRILQACATGVLMVMVMALILLVFPREKRGQAMGLVGLVIGFAPAVGPSLGGFLVDVVGWRVLFCIVVCLAVIIILCSIKALQNKEGFTRTSADALSVVFSTIGLASLLYGLSSFASSEHVEVCVALMIIGAFFVVLFVRRQFKLDEPMLRLEVLFSRRYRTAFITVAFLQATLIGLGVLMPLYIQNVLGYSATVSGLVTLPGALLGAVTGLWAGHIFDRLGVRIISVAGGAVLFAGGIGMFLYGISSPLLFVIIVNVLITIGMQMLVTPVNTWGVNSLKNELVQHATATTNTINQVGGSLGTALIMSFSALGTSLATQGSDLERIFAGYHLSFAVVMAMAAIVFIIILFFVRNKKTDVLPNTVPVSASSAEAKYDKGSLSHVAQGANVIAAEGGRALKKLVEDVMDRHPLTVQAADPVSSAAKTLAKSNASGAIVVDDKGKACGFISNSDVLRFFGDESQLVTNGNWVVLRELDNEDVRDRIAKLADIKVSDIATKKVIGIPPTATFEEACNVLATKRLKELPVLENGKVIGVVRRRDLMNLIANVLEEAE